LAERKQRNAIDPHSRQLRYEDYLGDQLSSGVRRTALSRVPARHHSPYPDGAAVWVPARMDGRLGIPDDEGHLVTMLMMREEKRIGTIAFGPFLTRRSSHRPAIGGDPDLRLACYALPPLQDVYAAFMARLPPISPLCRNTRTPT